jgi:hypothetical protein
MSRKLEIWKVALLKYVENRTWTGELTISLFYPNPPILAILCGIPQAILLGTILATIWKYHHSSIQDNEPFDRHKVSAAIDIAVNLVVAQLEEKRKQEEHRLQLPAQASVPTDANLPT